MDEHTMYRRLMDMRGEGRSEQDMFGEMLYQLLHAQNQHEQDPMGEIQKALQFVPSSTMSGIKEASSQSIKGLDTRNEPTLAEGHDMLRKLLANIGK